MLSERQLEAILKIYQQRAQKVVEDYLKRMGEHIRDIGKLTQSDIDRLVELKRMNYNMRQIKREIANAANIPASDMDKIFTAVAESDVKFANEVFASDLTPRIKDNPTLERILKAQAKITQQTLDNLSQTTILSDGYRNAVDVAVQTAQMGIVDYHSAIRGAFKAAAQNGLRVQYPSGLTRRLDSAIRMNVLDGIRAVNQDIMRQVGKEFRADGVEISAHALCAEDHLPYQGTQMSEKEFERLQNRLDRPFGMWNCRHNWWPIILGVSQPAYSPEELAEFKNNSRQEITIDGVTKTRYQWTQEQRRVETAVRYQKDIAIAAKASGDDLLRRTAQRNINRLQKYYQQISEKAGLIPDKSRMAVTGFRKVKTADELKNPPKYGIINIDKDLPALHSLSNKQAREWYLKHDARIPDLIDKTASIEVQARQAFDFRNLYRKVARDLMKDQEARKKLDENHPNWTFEGLIAHKMEKKKLSRDEAIRDILNTSTKTNAEVNAKFGLDVKK